MTADRIHRVGVVGAGQMGGGIAEACARAEADVVVWERDPEAAAAGRARIIASLDRAVSSGKITEREREQAAGRLRMTDDLTDFADRQLVVEAVVEDEEVKTAIFAELDRVVTDPRAVLASNTSSIPIRRLAEATAMPARVLGLHFFNPVPVLPLVELVVTDATDPAVAVCAEAFARDVLGKDVVRSADRSGFIGGALLVPFLLAAIRMVESGLATAADVDKTVTLGLAHPMGPLELADLIGLDTVAAIARRMHAESGEALHAPPAVLTEMTDAGLLGKKTCRGFYRYADNGRIIR